MFNLSLTKLTQLNMLCMLVSDFLAIMRNSSGLLAPPSITSLFKNQIGLSYLSFFTLFLDPD